MKCPKTSKCGCPGVRCIIHSACRGKTKSVCKPSRKPSRKAAKSRRKPSCGPGKVRNRSTGRCRIISRRKPSRKAAKSRRKISRKPSCGPGRVRNRSTGRCRMVSRRKPSRKAAKSRRRKSVSAGWSKLSPNAAQRTTMLKKCGKKCFLGPNKSFPICAKGTCKVNDKGLHAAYVRSKQWGGSPKKYKGKSRPTMKQATYQKIARSAKARLARRGYKVRNYKNI